MATVGSLVVDLRGNTATFQRDMGRAQSILRGSVQGMERNLKGLMGSVTSLQRGLGTLGISLSVAAVVAFGKSMIAGADATAAMGKQLMITTDLLQALDAEAATSGVSADSLHAAITRLNEAIGEATGGNRTVQQSFVDLGVSFENADGTARDTASTMEDLSQRYAAAADKTKFLSDASNVLGRNVAELQAIFEALAGQGIQGVIDKQKELGAVASTSTLEALKEFGDSATTVWNSIFVAAQEATAEALKYFGIVARPELEAIDTELSEKYLEAQRLRDKMAGYSDSGTGLLSGIMKQLADQVDGELTLLYKEIVALEDRQRVLREMSAPSSSTTVAVLPPVVDPDEADRIKAAKEEMDGYAEAIKKVNAAIDERIERQKDLDDASISLVQKKLDAEAEEFNESLRLQRERIEELTGAMNTLGASAAASASGAQSWKEFWTDAIETVFEYLFRQLGKLKSLGGEGGSIFEKLPGLFDELGNLFGGSSTSAPIFGGNHAHGGSFTVGGAGGTDSKMVALRATPGEIVSVRRGNAGGGGGTVVIVNNYGKDPATTKESRGSDGRKIVEVTVGQAASKDIATRGPLAQTMEATYGLSRRGY